MSHDKAREVLMGAAIAGQNGFPLEPAIAEAIATGDRKLLIRQFNFDSLAWMEFCISVELQSAQELTPDLIANMRFVFEIEDWLRARL